MRVEGYDVWWRNSKDLRDSDILIGRLNDANPIRGYVRLIVRVCTSIGGGMYAYWWPLLFNGDKGINLHVSGRSILRRSDLHISSCLVRESGGNEAVGHQVLPKGHDIMYCERNV